MRVKLSIKWQRSILVVMKAMLEKVETMQKQKQQSFLFWRTTDALANDKDMLHVPDEDDDKRIFNRCFH